MTRAVMTIHGFLTDTTDFGRLYDYLGFYDKVVPCEIPGHNGKVDFSLFTVDSTIETVNACFDSLAEKYDEVDVVGFSMGGALASYIAATKKPRKCVLMAPANKYLNPRFMFDALKYYVGLQHKTYKSAQGKMREKVSAVRETMQPYHRNISACLKLEFDKILPNLNRHTYTVFSKLIKLINKSLDESVAIDVQTLILRGDLDDLVPRSSVDYLKEHFTNCTEEQFEDVGHGMLYTNRDNVIIPKVVQFLSDGEIVPEVPVREV